MPSGRRNIHYHGKSRLEKWGKFLITKLRSMLHYNAMTNITFRNSMTKLMPIVAVRLTWVLVVTLAVFLSIRPCFGQASSQPAHDTHLQAIDWMTAGTWTSEFKTPDGKPFTIQTKLRWADTGTAIYFESRFNHEPHYFGMYAYDPGAKQIKVVYVSNDGQFTTGFVEPGADELKLDFEVASDRGKTHHTSRIKRQGQDSYVFTVFDEGRKTIVGPLVYTRK
jgi:hypothetical protein